jgi:hypothetical protein
MRRLRPAALLLGLGVGVLFVTPLGVLAGPDAKNATGATNASGQQPEGVTFTLVKPTSCPKPAKALGNACVDATGMVEPEGYKWVVGNGTAQRNGELYQTSFNWTVPPTIPGKLQMAIKAKGLKGNRVCPAISVSGSFGSGQIYKCAESGKELNEKLDVTLKPFNAAAGTPWSLTVSVLDGPDYTYTYRAGAAAASSLPTCRAPVRLPASATQAAKECRYFVQFSFDSLLVIPNGRVETTRGTGSFYVVLGPKDSSACTDEGVVLVRHEHQPLRGSDTESRLSDNGKFCLGLKGRGSKTLTALIGASVRVTGSDDVGCGPGEVGNIGVRAGEPFNIVQLKFCKHGEKYWPVGQDPPAKVNVRIDIKPAGNQ